MFVLARARDGTHWFTPDGSIGRIALDGRVDLFAVSLVRRRGRVLVDVATRARDAGGLRRTLRGQQIVVASDR